MEVGIEGFRSLCDRARIMIREGADPEMPVVWMRGGVAIFAPRPLRVWAGYEVREAEGNSPMRFRRRSRNLPSVEDDAGVEVPEALGRQKADPARIRRAIGEHDDF